MNKLSSEIKLNLKKKKSDLSLAGWRCRGEVLGLQTVRVDFVKSLQERVCFRLNFSFGIDKLAIDDEAEKLYSKYFNFPLKLENLL